MDQNVPHNMPEYPNVSAHQADHDAVPENNKPGFITGSVNVLGLRVPNLIIILLVLALAYFLYTHTRKTTHSLAPHVGGALDSSASPGTGSFLRNLNVN